MKKCRPGHLPTSPISETATAHLYVIPTEERKEATHTCFKGLTVRLQSDLILGAQLIGTWFVSMATEVHINASSVDRELGHGVR